MNNFEDSDREIRRRQRKLERKDEKFLTKLEAALTPDGKSVITEYDMHVIIRLRT